jgi:hypothetical protein
MSVLIKQFDCEHVMKHFKLFSVNTDHDDIYDILAKKSGGIAIKKIIELDKPEFKLLNYYDIFCGFKFISKYEGSLKIYLQDSVSNIKIILYDNNVSTQMKNMMYKAHWEFFNTRKLAMKNCQIVIDIFNTLSKQIQIETYWIVLSDNLNPLLEI